METDSIKWPSEFPELQRIDSALKCGICYDYMKTSMVTPCSHTYCSLCIRKYLQYCNKCPACFVECHENGLRNSRPLDAVVSNFFQVRDKLLRAIRVAEAASQRPLVDPVSSPQSAVTPQGTMKAFMTPPSTKTARNCLFRAEPRVGAPPAATSPGCRVPQMFTKPSPVSSRRPTSEETASCPVCQVDIPAKNINLHLDACLSRSTSQPKPEPVKRKRDPLPKRLYNLLSDKMLKKVLKDYGLSVQGDRKAWLTRLRRYIVLYNSETDVDNPRPVSEILHQVEREEREEAKKNINPLFKRLSQMVDRNSNEKEIDAANKKYLEDHKSNFEKLIEMMKKRNGNKVKKPKPIVESDEECTGETEETPSTSAQAENIYDQDTVELSDLEDPDYVPEGVISGPGQSVPEELDSSQDSVFDSTTRSLRTSTPHGKKFAKVTTRRAASPDVFSSPGPPTDDIYQSVFGSDEPEPTERTETAEADGLLMADDEVFADENEAPADNISVDYGDDDDTLRAEDNGENDQRETVKPPRNMQAKRKEPTNPEEDVDRPIRRSKRSTKKRKYPSS